MTKETLTKEMAKMEQVIDYLLDVSILALDNRQYQLLRYYFSQSDYDKMLKELSGNED